MKYIIKRFKSGSIVYYGPYGINELKEAIAEVLMLKGPMGMILIEEVE
ncbi:MAG: hypothetical protein ACE5IO_07105 [Thermoplasmata archaeon]